MEAGDDHHHPRRRSAAGRDVRGLLAAQEVFDKAGVTPDQAAMARFVVEGWDIRGFTGKLPEDELAICTVWDEADQAAVQACCAGWPADKVPGSADLELVREPQRFRFTSEEERSEWLFQTADAGILEEMCEEGYFNDGRPEDEVAFLLDDWDFGHLTEEQRRLYDERIDLSADACVVFRTRPLRGRVSPSARSAVVRQATGRSSV